MQQEKRLPAQAGISTLVGIIIIIVAAVILFGGVFAYQYFVLQKLGNQSQVQNQNQNQQTNNTQSVDFSKLNKDELLHKLFPNLIFINGVANLPSEFPYNMLKLHLQDSIEGYFTNKREKNLLLEVKLDGVPHVGGLYHAYLGLFDKNSNLLTSSSYFGSQNGQPNEDPFNFYNDEAQFGGDLGEFNFYDCNEIKYILFTSHGCPNGSCCSGGSELLRINNGVFEKVQTINSSSLGNPNYNLKISPLDNGISIKRVPARSDNACPETNYKELKWDKNSCIFK
jgi:hypothetical protein